MSQFQRYMAILRGYWWLVLVVFMVTVLSAIGVTWNTVPVYEATATLQFLTPEQKFDNVLEEAFSLRKGKKLETELELLKNRTLAEETVRRLHYQLQLLPGRQGRELYRTLRKLWGAAPSARQALSAFTLRDVELGPVSAPQTYTLRFTGTGEFLLHGAEDKRPLGEGSLGQRFQGPQFAFTLEHPEVTAGDTVTLQLLPLSDAIKHFQQHISTALLRDTELITISAQGGSPELAQNMATALAEGYIAFSQRQKTYEASRALDFVEQQLTATQASFQANELALSQYKSQKGLVTLHIEVQAIVDRLTQFEASLKQAQSARQEIETILRRLQQGQDPLESRVIYALGSSLGNHTLEAFAQRLAELQVAQQALGVKYHLQHPSMVEARQQIAQMQEKIRDALTALLADFRGREASLQQSVRQYEARLTHLPQAERALADLTRQTQINEKIYTFLLQKREEMRIIKASTVGNVRIVDWPALPEMPIKPNKRKNLMLAALLGMIGGVSLAFFLEHYDDSVKTVEGAEQHVGLPVLGIIPQFSLHRRHKHELVWRTMAAEGYRSLRTNIRLVTYAGERPRRLAITSSQPGDGKSTVASNLAMCLGTLGYNTLLVDADLRRPTLHRMFGVVREPGLAEVLRGKTRWNSVIKAVGTNLHLLPAGNLTINASEWLDSPAMRDLLGEWEKVYTYILFDVPAVLAVTDPVVVGTHCQGILFVVRAHSTPTPAIRRALACLESTHVPIVGLVLNGLKPRRMQGYYYSSARRYVEDHLGTPLPLRSEVASNRGAPGDRT